MTKNYLIAAVAGGAILVAGTSAGVVADNSTKVLTATTTTSSPLGAPPVGIVSVGSDAIEVDYGPSQPGPFIGNNPTARSLTITWPASRDDAHPLGLKYRIFKNGKLINTISNTYTTVGFTTSVRQFRFCVQTVNSAGKYSPQGCTTFTGR